MISRLELSTAELKELLAAVLEANGLAMQGMEARDATGAVVSIASLSLECKHPGLAVDIRPPNRRLSLAERIQQSQQEYLDRAQTNWQLDPAGSEGLVDGQAANVEGDLGSG